jgi:hypothetical protein
MQANQSKRDYMLIAHPAARAARRDEGSFKYRFETAVEAAHSACPDVEWRAGFVLGPKDYVEVFSAPSSEAAQKVVAVVGALGGLRAEVVALNSVW